MCMIFENGVRECVRECVCLDDFLELSAVKFSVFCASAHCATNLTDINFQVLKQKYVSILYPNLVWL